MALRRRWTSDQDLGMSNSVACFRLLLTILAFQDLEDKRIVDELKLEKVSQTRAAPAQCISLAWSADGQTLYAGYTDNQIRVWQVSIAQSAMH